MMNWSSLSKIIKDNEELMCMENIIEIKNLQKSYGKFNAVKDISFEVKNGDMFAFLGQNGAGKSTTIRCMLGLIKTNHGEIKLFNGKYENQKDILQNIGYMPSEAMFYPSMKAGEIISFAANVRKKDCKEEASRLCEILEVPVGKRIQDLSLGNRKKVSIVCALQHNPELLILDEPTSGLDPLMQEKFFELLVQKNKEGVTCFLSSHVLSEVKRYCKNAAIIKNGELIKTDSIENLIKSNLRLVKIWKNDKEEAFSYQGSMSELISRLNDMEIDDVLIEEQTLEDMFMDYYKE